MTDKDTLMNLIDEYAETRHRYGRIHNARTEAARNAVIEALSGVQALSAAPEAIAKLRHLYRNMVNGAVRDTASAKRIAEGLLAPAVEALERATPPAEKQARPGAVYAELPAPTASIGIDDAWHEPAMRYFADRTHALRMQAAPKAAPVVGNSGFDHQTAADFLSGKTISDEAVRKFVAASRWAHNERAALSATLLAMHGVLTSRNAEIALLKRALMEVEAAPAPNLAKALNQKTLQNDSLHTRSEHDNT